MDAKLIQEIMKAELTAAMQTMLARDVREPEPIAETKRMTQKQLTTEVAR